MKGSVGVGYRLFNETFFGVRLMMGAERKISAGINDYGVLMKKCSEFLYTPIEMTEALAIRKFHFTNVVENSTLKGFKKRICTNYKYLIQDPLQEHHEEMACKFKNRTDYVDFGAKGLK